MAFQDIVGNERIKNILRRSLQKERLPSSLLFCGPAGSGMRETALVLAKALCCQRLKDDACEDCGPCRAINRGEAEGANRYPDVLVYEPDRRKEAIDIASMREMKEIACIRPMMGARRIFIVDEAEKMTLEAANSVLKVLEEPPSFAHFILITSNPELILPTIQSRCRILSFAPISQLDIEKALRASGRTEEQARILSLLSRGNLEEALERDWDEVTERRRAAWTLFRGFLRREGASAFLENYGSLKRKDAEAELPAVLEIFSAFGRDLALIKEGGEDDLLLNPDYADLLRRESETLSLEGVLHFLSRVDAALAGLDRSLNVRLLVSTFYSSIMR
jgi:DNA polymerase-3 subunit delta'